MPSIPRNFYVSTANSRLAPSAWLDEVRIFNGQFGQVMPLFSCSGGGRHDFELCDGLCALPERGADAVRSGVAAADHDDMLALGENFRGIAERLGGNAAVLLRQEIHREQMDAVEVAAGNRRDRGRLLRRRRSNAFNQDVRQTVDGQLVGTPQYLAPEQARGAEVSPQTDVYSLGVMAYELFLEQLPFEAETVAEIMTMHLRVPPPPPRELWPEVPPQLEELLLAMLAKQPEHRPTVREVAHQLEAVRSELARRDQAIVEPQPAGGALPIEAPRARRLIASTGRAPTEPAWQQGSRRWQYAVGALALAASAMMFFVSRAGNLPPAAAATTSPAKVSTDRDRDVVRPAQVVQVAPVAPPAAAAELIPVSAPPPAPRTSIHRSTTSPPRRVSARTSPALPPGDQRLDPDGTIEPY